MTLLLVSTAQKSAYFFFMISVVIMMKFTKISKRRVITMADVFSPIHVKKVHFMNRIVMAPMVRFGFPCRDGIMGEALQKEYIERSHQHIGLLISQVLSISATQGPGVAGGAGAYTEKHVAYLNKIVTACHQSGSRFFGQLGLGGYAYGDQKSQDINDLSTTEIIELRDAFIRAAAICKKAGMDGIELNGAHRYFFNMMASSHTNKRMDQYGGNLLGRLTLAKEIIEGIQCFAGENFIVSYRMGWSEELETDVQTAQALEAMGLDMIHVSTGIPPARPLPLPDGFAYNEVVYTGCYVKKFVHIPVIVVNDIQTLDRGNTLLTEDHCDFVAYGKPFLADAAFVTHSMENMMYKPCLKCRVCQWFTHGETCPARVLNARRLEREK